MRSRTVLFLVASLYLSACQTGERVRDVKLGSSKVSALETVDNSPREIISAADGDEIYRWDLGSIIFRNNEVVCKLSRNTVKVPISVNSYNELETKSKRIVILPGRESLNPNSSEFASASRMLAKILAARGYEIVSKEDSADVLLFFNFGISEPQKHSKTWTTPVYNYTPNQNPGSSQSTYAVSNQYGQPLGTVQGKTQYNYDSYGTYSYAGERTHHEEWETYIRFVDLVAIDKTRLAEKNGTNQLWKVTAVSEGQTDDLRLILPFLLISAEGFIETDSGGWATAPKYFGDIRVDRLSDRTPSSQNKKK